MRSTTATAAWEARRTAHANLMSFPEGSAGRAAAVSAWNHACGQWKNLAIAEHAERIPVRVVKPLCDLCGQVRK